MTDPINWTRPFRAGASGTSPGTTSAPSSASARTTSNGGWPEWVVGVGLRATGSPGSGAKPTKTRSLETQTGTVTPIGGTPRNSSVNRLPRDVSSPRREGLTKSVAGAPSSAALTWEDPPHLAALVEGLEASGIVRPLDADQKITDVLLEFEREDGQLGLDPLSASWEVERMDLAPSSLGMHQAMVGQPPQ